MEINITLEQALQKASQGLRFKMQHSIELLKKAEQLSLLYDNGGGYFLAFSGGKDSQALYHITQLSGVKFTPHFSPTTVDPPQVIRFIRRNYQDVVFEKVTKNIYDKAAEMEILPTMRVRWCCAEYKEGAGAGKVTLIGIRHAESTRRSKRKEVEVSSHKFSGNFEEFSSWQEERLKKKYKNINQDQFSYNKEQQVRCISGKDSILVSPIIEWTEKDVWEFLNKVVDVPHCELYDKGYTRIGCIMCPMSSRKQKLKECKDFPWVKAKWIEAIKKIRRGGGLTVRPYAPPQHWRTQAQMGGGQNGDTSKPATRDTGTSQVREEIRPHNILRSTPMARKNTGMWEGNFPNCRDYPNSEELENQIAENIFDWWISGKAYEEWYRDKFLQQKFDF